MFLLGKLAYQFFHKHVGLCVIIINPEGFHYSNELWVINDQVSLKAIRCAFAIATLMVAFSQAQVEPSKYYPKN